VKTTKFARERGYDGGKKITGIKRSVAVDTNGLPHAFLVTTANISDRKSALEMLETSEKELSNVSAVLCDGGYTGNPFQEGVRVLLDADVQIAKRSELHQFAVIPKRWVVERTFAWLDDFRRLWKNCERKLHTSQQMMALAFLAICLKRL
jgi:transposase